MQSVVHDLGGDLNSPGLTVLDRRTTVFDEAIFNTATLRRSQILEWLHFVGDSELLEFVLTHELGHAICRDPDEARAADNGENLTLAESSLARRRSNVRGSRRHKLRGVALWCCCD